MTGEDVVLWDRFLAGAGFDVDDDGTFDASTVAATKAFQLKYGLGADGIVGNRTWGKAMEMGLDVIADSDSSEDGPNWPPRPRSLQPLTSNVDREALFGKFSYVPAPIAGNPEAIRITDNWGRDNIVQVRIPQLQKVDGAPRSGLVFFHKVCAQTFVDLFQAWEDTGLIHLVKTWGGSFVPRFQRGSRSRLSNHSYGSAFDINVVWNLMGRQPALKGQTGSVRELVPIANQMGIFWGGHYNSRLDGMHFEIGKR
jgi:hypothetical protein